MLSKVIAETYKWLLGSCPELHIAVRLRQTLNTILAKVYSCTGLKARQRSLWKPPTSYIEATKAKLPLRDWIPSSGLAVEFYQFCKSTYPASAVCCNMLCNLLLMYSMMECSYRQAYFCKARRLSVEPVFLGQSHTALEIINDTAVVGLPPL
jgi:hypothetical protein